MLTVRRARGDCRRGPPVDPTDLVPLSMLAAEGFGYGGQHVATPRDAIDALAAQLGGEVVLDDLGRRCVNRETARRLFAERVALEAKQREVLSRQEARFAELEAANRPWAGLPAGLIPDGVTPGAAMLQMAKDAQPCRRSVLEHALADRDGQIEYIPIGPVPE